MTDKMRLRFPLRWLLAAVTLAAIAAGWYTDRARLAGQMQAAQSDVQLLEAQLAALQSQSKLRTAGGMQIFYWWAGADEFMEMLKSTEDEETFITMAPSLARADDPVLKEAVLQLTQLLSEPDQRNKIRALNALRFIQEAAPERLQPYSSAIVSAAVPLLGGASDEVVGTAIFTVQSFGADAGEALDPLRTIMSDDEAWFAPEAAVAIGGIDSETDVGPRLAELVRNKHPSWYQAAFHLVDHMEPEQARKVLKQAYDDAANDAERNMVIQTLNRIPVGGNSQLPSGK